MFSLSNLMHLNFMFFLSSRNYPHVRKTKTIKTFVFDALKTRGIFWSMDRVTESFTHTKLWYFTNYFGYSDEIKVTLINSFYRRKLGVKFFDSTNLKFIAVPSLMEENVKSIISESFNSSSEPWGYGQVVCQNPNFFIRRRARVHLPTTTHQNVTNLTCVTFRLKMAT